MGEGASTFVDIKSLLLVLGGTFGALLVAYSMEEVSRVPGGVGDFFKYESPNLASYVTEFTELSRTARREGLLALDRKLSELEDDLMKFGLEMAIDGIEEAEIEELVDDRIAESLEEKNFLAKFFNTAGTYAPAFGMVGTLIGLIQMLQSLEDPSTIGPAMAVALITTFYGALFANLVFLPFANKMKAQMTEMYKAQRIIRMGIMAIVRGDSPTMIEKRLSAFIEDGEEAESETELRKAA